MTILQEILALTEIVTAKQYDFEDFIGSWIKATGKGGPGSIERGERIVHIPITKLVPHEPASKVAKGRADETSERNIRFMMKDMRRHVKLPPIVVKRQGQKFLIIDGHHRWEAAKRLKLPTVPAILIKSFNIHPGKIEDVLLFDRDEYSDYVSDSIITDQD